MRSIAICACIMAGLVFSQPFDAAAGVGKAKSRPIQPRFPRLNATLQTTARVVQTVTGGVLVYLGTHAPKLLGEIASTPGETTYCGAVLVATPLIAGAIISASGAVKAASKGAHLLPTKLRQKWVEKRWIGYENVRSGLLQQAKIPLLAKRAEFLVEKANVVAEKASKVGLLDPKRGGIGGIDAGMDMLSWTFGTRKGRFTGTSIKRRLKIGSDDPSFFNVKSDLKIAKRTIRRLDEQLAE